MSAKTGAMEKRQRTRSQGDLESLGVNMDNTTWVRERYLRMFEFGEEDCSTTTVGWRHWTCTDGGVAGLLLDGMPVGDLSQAEPGVEAELEDPQPSDEDEDDDDDYDDDVLSRLEEAREDGLEEKQADPADDGSVKASLDGKDSFQSTKGKNGGNQKMLSHFMNSMWSSVTSVVSNIPNFGPLAQTTHVASANSSSRSVLSTDGRGPYSRGSSEVAYCKTMPWGWVLQYDELLREMKEGRVFAGFSEGIITFPPSFRWKPGAGAGEFDHVGTITCPSVCHRLLTSSCSH